MHKELKLGTLLNYINLGIGILTSFILTPYLIKILGSGEYGLYALIGAFAGYLQLFDFGIGTTTVRYVAKYNEENDFKSRENFLAISQIIYCVIGVLITIVAIILYKNLNNIFAKTIVGDDLEKAKTMFILLVINIVFSIVFAGYKAIITGFEKFIFPKVVSIILSIAKLISIFSILNAFPTAVVLTAITVTIGIVSNVANIVYVKRLKVRIKLHYWDKKLFKEIMIFSMFNFLQIIMSQLYWKIDELVIGIMISTAMVSVYNVAMQINNVVLTVTTTINEFTLPIATKMIVRKKSKEDVTRFIARVGRFTEIMYLAIGIAFSFFGKEFITLWIGTEYTLVYPIVMIVIWASFIPRIQSTANDIMKAKNMHGFLTTLYAVSAIINVLFTIWFIKLYGIVGASIATALSLIISNTIIANIYFKNKLNIDVILLFKLLFEKLWKSVIITIVVCVLLNFFITEINYFNFIMKCFVFITIYGITIYLVGMNVEEKKQVNNIFEKMRGKNNE